ncbi:hypothetical protein EPUS_08468 [Endocarpon pusillum Z07020]|uniref:Uncharacterized protein n=1 Tax=Endocarpon pusillum (strain Z07020 / HMAS-L-300199) TaxID=1263415 RepID=U1I4X1_ENDPU|nr:uncharacterized protein EPUS_08468 [Endocarpon pusillum Z07020]ERF77164.1 hypothetical protein EPUS_08468 [Endocarpon pusillum Z07020]
MVGKRYHVDNPPKTSIQNKASTSKNNCTNPNKGPKSLNANANEFTPHTDLNPTSGSKTEVVDSLSPLQRSDTNPYDESSSSYRPRSRPSGCHDLEEAFQTATTAYQQDIRRTSSYFPSDGYQEEVRRPPEEPVKEDYYYPACLPLPAPCPRMEKAWQTGKIAEAIRASYRASCEAKGKSAVRQ